jgi:hypothetical protein
MTTVDGRVTLPSLSRTGATVTIAPLSGYTTTPIFLLQPKAKSYFNEPPSRMLEPHEYRYRQVE